HPQGIRRGPLQTGNALSRRWAAAETSGTVSAHRGRLCRRLGAEEMALLRSGERVRVSRARHFSKPGKEGKRMTSGRLAGRRILLGVAGSIAAYKAVLLARLLVKERADVRVVMTKSATEFVGASTFAGVTGKPALTGMFDPSVGGER